MPALTGVSLVCRIESKETAESTIYSGCAGLLISINSLIDFLLTVAGNFLLYKDKVTLIKLAIGITSGSVAVLASAIDSILDMFVSIFNYFAISNSEKPADKIFNYGRGKITRSIGERR